MLAEEPTMSPARIDLTASEMREALDALYAIGEASLSRDEFARRGVDCLPRLARSELTTLSICDLDSGRRSVVSDRKDVISRRDLEVFDRHFFAHPLVCAHGRNPRATTKRIGDLLSESEFRRRPLYGDYYRPIGIDRVMAVPV